MVNNPLSINSTHLAIVPGYLLLTFTKLPSWNECLDIPDSLRITEDVKEEDLIVEKKRHK